MSDGKVCSQSNNELWRPQIESPIDYSSPIMAPHEYAHCVITNARMRTRTPKAHRSIKGSYQSLSCLMVPRQSIEVKQCKCICMIANEFLWCAAANNA